MKKKVDLQTLLKNFKSEEYQAQVLYITELIKTGAVTPVKSSGSNGKTPPLSEIYWQEIQGKDYSQLEYELNYKLAPQINPDYYKSHLAQYEKDREAVIKLSNYLSKHKSELTVNMAEQERIYCIWQNEKFHYRTVLKRCGLTKEFLNMYEPAEPYAYYSQKKTTPQTILIIENSATFFTMRNKLLEGYINFWGQPIGTIIYGAGKRKEKSFSLFSLGVEPYISHPSNTYLYWGDLDYEGIGIFEQVSSLLAAQGIKINPFLQAYSKMLEKAQDINLLLDTKEHQNKNISDKFFSFFTLAQQSQLREILHEGKYIPQEIINPLDFV